MAHHFEMSRKKRACCHLAKYFVAIIFSVIGGCASTPQLTGTWKGIARVVEVIDKNNHQHQVVGIEITDTVNIEKFTARGIYFPDPPTDKELENTFLGFFPRELFNNTPLLLQDKQTVILASQVDYIGKSVRIQGQMGYSRKGPFMPVNQLPVIRLSCCAIIEDGQHITKEYSSRCDFVFVGTIEPAK